MSAHLRGVRRHWSATRVVGVCHDVTGTPSRRLRKPPGPRWIIHVTDDIAHEDAKRIASAWRAAERSSIAIVTGGITVTRGRP